MVLYGTIPAIPLSRERGERERDVHTYIVAGIVQLFKVQYQYEYIRLCVN